jgi:hypothetical protein
MHGKKTPEVSQKLTLVERECTIVTQFNLVSYLNTFVPESYIKLGAAGDFKSIRY